MKDKKTLTRPSPDDQIKKSGIIKALEKITPLMYFARILRDQKMITRFHRYYYNRNCHKIELDLTYQCNMACTGCNRSCPQAPGTDKMSVEQVEKFVDESLRKNARWESIMLVGGEPTLHPDFYRILAILNDYKTKHSPDTSIVLTTNGKGQRTKSVLRELPDWVVIDNTDKTTLSYKHEVFNEAPQDYFLYKFADYTYGCGKTYHCGTGLTPYGYYVCPIAGGGIDRVFGFDKGRKELPDDDDQMLEQRLIFCSLCGHFKQNFKEFNQLYLSSSWENGYNQYKKEKPILSRY